MTKPKSAPGADAAAKKKSTPKARKRKASDASSGAKASAAPAKRAASGDGAGGVPSSAIGGGGVVESSAAAVVKPFVKGELVESIKHMMFGFGDDATPLDETGELMEDLVVEYVHSMTKKAMDLAAVKGKLDTECFIFLIRKDPERYERIAELLRANDEFRSVLNSGFDPSDEKMY